MLRTLQTSLWLALLLAAAAALTCDPGSYYWVCNGIERCSQCPAGCACPGGFAACVGCTNGLFSAAAGASACSACPAGSTTDPLFNSGCDPANFEVPCTNAYGPLGYTVCRPDPPLPNATIGELNPHLPSGALFAPPQYLTSAPPYVPNTVPPYYDIDGQPMVQQSY